MRDYIYKVIIFAIAAIVIFEFTIGKEISQINKKVDYLQHLKEEKKL